MSAKRLTKCEKSFINAYNGSIKETAIAVKMSYGYGRKLMTLDYIVDAIKQREENVQEIIDKPNIATRLERQAFWTNVMNGTLKETRTVIKEDGTSEDIPIQTAMRDRLKAAELLGKSYADFTENLNLSGPDKGLKKEITDDMPQKEATSAYMELLKETDAGHA